MDKSADLSILALEEAVKTEKTRRQALERVRQAFEDLQLQVDASEVSYKKIRLLELWHHLIQMRHEAWVLEEADGEEEGQIKDESGASASLSSAEPPSEVRLSDPIDRSNLAAEQIITPVEHIYYGEAITHEGQNWVEQAPLDRVRLRLIRPGILHDMVLPTGTIVLVHSSDANDILERGIAEIFIGRDPDDLPKAAH
jgi:hypothetical protein